MLVLRVEHPTTKAGPYFTTHQSDEVVSVCLEMRDRHYDPIKRPGWSRDFDKRFGSIDSEYRYGFDTIEKLIEWFEDSWDILKEKFVISLYEAEEIVMGKSQKQLVFIPKEHRASYPISEFLRIKDTLSLD